MQNEVEERPAGASEGIPAEGSMAVQVDDKPLKVAIVGGSDTKGLAPYDSEDWEIWGMNNTYANMPRSTRWFEIHPIKFENGHYFRRKQIRPGVFKWSLEFRGQKVDDYMADLAGLDIPVYMQKPWESIPKSLAYPLDKVLQKFGNYFTNSVSYMIALAILDGAKEIGCFGVDMATGSEYGPQRPSCEFFLGVAAGLGLVLNIPPQADLLKTKFLYGFQEREQMEFEEKLLSIMAGMASRKQKALAQFEFARKQVEQYTGAEEGVKEIQRIWSNLADEKIWRDPS